MVRTTAPKVVFLALVVTGLSIGSTLIHSGCTGNECAFDEKNQDQPVEGGLDCPPDQSCYIGQCFRQCNPGVERNEPCSSNDDCKESSRPNCVFLDAIAGSFCSTCDEGQTCVLGLNICQPVADIPDPMIPSVMKSPTVPLPLDGGQIDGSTFEDAGVDMPVATNVDYAGFVTLLQVTDSVAVTGDRATGDVSFCNVANATEVIQDRMLNAIDRCELRVVKRYVGTSTPTNLGTITFEPGNDSAMTVEGVSAQYEPAIRDYLFEAPLPQRLLTYSTAPPSNHKFVIFGGGGVPGVASPWTGVNNGLMLIPYELVPSPETLTLLNDVPIDISLTNPVDLRFAWGILPPDVDGTDLGISVIVEIGGQRSPCENDDSRAEQYAIRCQLNEGFLAGNPEIIVPAGLIAEYTMLVMPLAGERVPVRFGRIRSESILFYGPTVMPPMVQKSSLVDLYFGQEFTSQAQFVR